MSSRMGQRLQPRLPQTAALQRLPQAASGCALLQLLPQAQAQPS